MKISSMTPFNRCAEFSVFTLVSCLTFCCAALVLAPWTVPQPALVTLVIASLVLLAAGLA